MSVSGVGSCGSSQNAAAIQQMQSVIGLRNLTGMGDQSVDGTSASQPSWASARDTFRSDLASLFSAVQSGDIKGAQSALATLQSDQAATYGANGQPVTRQTLRQDFSSLTQAIQSGDSSGAQKALQTLQQDVQTFGAQHPHHHHHHGGGGGPFVPASGNTASTASLVPAISTTSTDQDHDGDRS